MIILSLSASSVEKKLPANDFFFIDSHDVIIGKMKAIAAIAFMCCLFLDLHEGATHWEIQNLNIPQSHIPYFMGSKNHSQGFCNNGACQVTKINIVLRSRKFCMVFLSICNA